MPFYKHLTQEQRYQISGLKKAGYLQSAIAHELGVHKSTISRELRRNAGKRGYQPKQAQLFSKEKRKNCANNQRLTESDWQEVERLLREDFSPEQVSGRLKAEQVLRISHEHIYRHVYADKRA